ncbi:DNA-directed DNA/RNA polymerase mu-like [Oculina patagonica]
MASKRRKLEHDNEHSEKQLDEKAENTEILPKETMIYIVPKKIPKARLQVLNNLARKKGFPITEHHRDSVTHIVTGYETAERVLAFIERPLEENVEIVTLDWLSDCITAGKILDVTDNVKVRSAGMSTTQTSSNAERNTTTEETVFGEYQDTKFVCQRATPLKHHNTKFTDALEILERHAVYVDSGQRDSRALAFRRAACALKSYPKQITRIEEAAKLSSVGSHSKKVIQDILENGSSDEVQDIISSDFFKSMEIFSSVYGCGPATARKWYEKGYRSMADVIQAVSDGMKLTEQQTMGLKYHSDLVQPVPREEAIKIKEIVVRELDTVQQNCAVELVGGYRRGKPSGHDVDILITHQDEKKVEGLLSKLVERLEKLGHMRHKDLMVGRNPHFETKSGSQRQGGQMDNLDHCFCMFQVETNAENKTVETTQASPETDKTGSCADTCPEGRGGAGSEESGLDCDATKTIPICSFRMDWF